MSCNSSLFGPSAQYIKVVGGEFVAIEGANILERLNVSDLRMPYKQILKSRIILKPGQANYLLNYLGIGDNVTFLAIKAVYDPKSVIEDDNYINWSFYDNMSEIYSMAQMMVLTGNSTNRIKQMYLTNANSKRPVTLEVMVGAIDDEYSFFNDTLNQIGSSFTGLEFTDIKSYIVGESIVINDKFMTRPLIYINIVNIQSIERNNNLLIVDDSSYRTIFLQFLTEYDAIQAQSLLNYVIDNPNINIDDILPIVDSISPVMFFNEYFNNDGINHIYLDSDLSSPSNTSFGNIFTTLIDLSTYLTIDKQFLIDALISSISDNRDGIMSIIPSNVKITNSIASDVNIINNIGNYTITFNFSDIANNNLNNVIVNLIVV